MNAATEILEFLEKIRETESKASSASTVEDAIEIIQEAINSHWMGEPGQRRRMLRRAAAWALYALELHDAAEIDAPGAAEGHAFRAEELRYDSRGGMTEAQAARAFVIGATWTLCGEPLAIEATHAIEGVWLDGLRRAYGFWVRPSAMTREHGWKLVALARRQSEEA